jgi:hypothetical protein
MMGMFDEAKKNVELAKQAADRNCGNQGVRDGYLGVRARYILETVYISVTRRRSALERPSSPRPGHRAGGWGCSAA